MRGVYVPVTAVSGYTGGMVPELLPIKSRDIT